MKIINDTGNTMNLNFTLDAIQGNIINKICNSLTFKIMMLVD